MNRPYLLSSPPTAFLQFQQCGMCARVHDILIALGFQRFFDRETSQMRSPDIVISDCITTLDTTSGWDGFIFFWVTEGTTAPQFVRIIHPSTLRTDLEAILLELRPTHVEEPVIA